MTKTLESAHVKLKRANLHTKTLERELRRFFKDQPELVIRGRFEYDPTRCTFYVERGYEQPPGDPFSVIVGDAIHNFRCALDHVAWQLVLNGSDPDPKRPEQVQFPIYDTEARFDSHGARRLPGVGDGPVEFIKSRLAEKGWDHPNNPFTLLVNLSNADKHRALHLVVTGTSSMKIDFRCHDCEALGAFLPEVSPVLESGAPVGALRVTITGPNPEVRVNLGLKPRVTLQDRRRGLFWTLGEIRSEIEKVLDAPKILRGLR